MAIIRKPSEAKIRREAEAKKRQALKKTKSSVAVNKEPSKLVVEKQQSAINKKVPASSPKTVSGVSKKVLGDGNPKSSSNKTNDANTKFTFTKENFEVVKLLIYSLAGISLADTKMDMVYSRLARILRRRGLNTVEEYLTELNKMTDEDMIQEFINSLTTNKTSFYRESHHFDLLPKYIEQNFKSPIKLWCQASSAGQEPYTLAITLAEYYGGLKGQKILATDIDTVILEKAKLGEYPLSMIKQDIPAHLVTKYFDIDKERQVGTAKKILKDMIEFRQFNLLDPFTGVGSFEIIFCRNVMIYFEPDTQYDILEKSRKCLKPGGAFFAGHSENFSHAADIFKPIGKTIYLPSDEYEKGKHFDTKNN